MFKNQFVACIKANGQVLREFEDKVIVPYNQEYSILLKNLSAKRAIVNIFVDGDNAVPGGLIVDANKDVDLQRTIRNGNMNVGNKFKFIAKTAAIEKYRGNKAEDGLIRVEIQYEKDIVHYINNIYTRGIGGSNSGNGIRPMYGTDPNITLCGSSSSMHDSVPAVAQYSSGITVPGSESTQKFITINGFETETNKTTIILQLVGEIENKVVETPVTVKSKPKCTVCGKLNKAANKFCSECGTSLIIY